MQLKYISQILFILLTASIGGNNLSAQPSVSIAKYADNRKAAVSLTFDDGIQEHFTLVAPNLDKYGLKGTFGINGKFIGNRNDEFAPRMTWDEVRQLDQNGHEINNHTWSHPNLWEHPNLAMSELEHNDSAMIVELGHPSISVLFPFNAYNEEILALCNSKYVGARIHQFGLGQRNSHATRHSISEWLRKVIACEEWGITMTHGIHTAWDQWDDPQVLWDLFKTLHEKSDTIWIDTFANIQAYIKERDTSTLKINTYTDKMEISIDCPLPPDLYSLPLTLNVVDLPSTPLISITQGTSIIQYKNIPNGISFNADPHGGIITVVWIIH